MQGRKNMSDWLKRKPTASKPTMASTAIADVPSNAKASFHMSPKTQPPKTQPPKTQPPKTQPPKLVAVKPGNGSVKPRNGTTRSYEPQNDYQELKSAVHNKLLDLLDFAALEKLDNEAQKQEIRYEIETIIAEENFPLSLAARDILIQDVLNEVLGLGPLEALLQDDSVADILVNTYRQVYVERFGRLELTNVRFKDDAHLRRIIDKIVNNVGRKIDEASPMVDARLPDGSRVNAIIPPSALDGPIVSIRRFAVQRPQLEDLIRTRSITPEMAELLIGIARGRLNVLISGGTGSGKTTLLNLLSGYIPATERIITIEDSAELQLQQDHVVRLETRPANIEGRGEITQRDLVRNTLRMRPDRIVLGEVRGEEALDMLQAMNTGHDGSLTTIHANSPRDALGRVEAMVTMAGLNIPALFLRRFISSAVDVIIQASRLADGSRKVVSLQEITGMEGELITLQEIFTFEQTGQEPNGKVKGVFKATGIRPKFMDKLATMGIQISSDIFDERNVVEV
jgi:pilus assembly protein CpaF